MLGAVCPGEGQLRCAALLEPVACLGTLGGWASLGGDVCWFQGIGWTGRAGRAGLWRWGDPGGASRGTAAPPTGPLSAG